MGDQLRGPSVQTSHLIPGFLQRIKECNVGLESFNDLIPWSVSGRVVGRMNQE
jgi:hypothetical protein